MAQLRLPGKTSRKDKDFQAQNERSVGVEVLVKNYIPSKTYTRERVGTSILNKDCTTLAVEITFYVKRLFKLQDDCD